jgi:hypothetical protein
MLLVVGIGFGLVSMVVRRVSRPHRAALAFGVVLAMAALPGELMGGGLTGFLFWIPRTLFTLLLLYLSAHVPRQLVMRS